MHNYCGSIHIHSNYSDGTGSIPEIAGEANAAGLDFIIITDHQNREGAYEEGNYGKTSVIVGTELNKNRNHYLALGTKSDIEDYDDTPQKTIDEVNRQGGFGFLAHPLEKGSPLVTEGAAFPWTDWSVENFTGIELWNYCSQWRDKALSKQKILYWYLFDRNGPVKEGPPPECKEIWDRLTQKKKVVAIGGTDAHAVHVRLGFFTAVIFPYYDLFRTVNTHIVLHEKLSSDFNMAKEQIFKALREGRCFISFDRYKKSNVFYFGAFNENQEVPMGSETEFSEGISLKITAPSKRSIIRIIKNGKTVCEKNEQHLIYKVPEKGTFRAEVYYKPKWGRPLPWIFSNPVYIK